MQISHSLREIPLLYPTPDACCGCGACVASCHQGALSLVEDKYGFVYPSLNESLCIGCGCCEKACGFQRNRYSASKGPWFAAADSEDFSNSASGGAFYSIARSVIHSGGVVYGAAYESRDNGLHVCHRRVDDIADLYSLQGSKYVQSSTVDIFRKVRTDLKEGLTVLFSGTPCQIAGLHGFLGAAWPNLITVDLVCHGVPSEKMFCSYVKNLEKHYNRRLINLVFRCKRYGWGHSLLLLLLRPFGCTDDSLDQEKLIHVKDSSYYGLFLKLKVMRDSCYRCPFAGPHRPGDLTVGDFWGVEQNRPDLISSGAFNLEFGISCVLSNTSHGLEHYNGMEGVSNPKPFHLQTLQRAMNSSAIQAPCLPIGACISKHFVREVGRASISSGLGENAVC